MNKSWKSYNTGAFFDELITPAGRPRVVARRAVNLLQSLAILATASDVLADKAIAGFRVREDSIAKALERNPILVTALNPIIGYELGAAIAKKAYAKGRPVKKVAQEMTDLSSAELDRLLDPLELTKGGIKS